jgi:DNA modification methylase
MINKIHQYNVLNTPWPLEDNSVDCIVTSPPYYGLRDYGVAGQLGLEETPEEFVDKMVLIFEDARRVLKPEGTLWLNLGDSYNSGSSNQNGRKDFNSTINPVAYYSNGDATVGRKKIIDSLKPKDLFGIPWMVAFALRTAGWYLRQDIIWHKPNPMPESVTDRCTKAHEYIFMLSKSSRYYYDADAIRTTSDWSLSDSKMPDGWDTGEGGHGTFHRNGREKGAVKKSDKQRGHSRRHAGFNDRWDNMTTSEQMSMGANKRSVWTVATHPFPEAHFATFPEQLITPCILAGCPKDGIVLDPFMGAGTTAIVAKSHGRNYIGFELNPKYIKIAENRLKKEFGMFYETKTA